MEKKEQDQEILVYQYRCPPQHCQACPKAAQCTPAPHKGRTIARSQHEDKVEELRQRMHTPEGEALYKKRGQTIEPRIGDLKAHRGLRCFAGFGMALALIQVGLLVLVHNALCLTPTSPTAERAGAKARRLSQDAPCQPTCNNDLPRLRGPGRPHPLCLCRGPLTHAANEKDSTRGRSGRSRGASALRAATRPRPSPPSNHPPGRDPATAGSRPGATGEAIRCVARRSDPRGADAPRLRPIAP